MLWESRFRKSVFLREIFIFSVLKTYTKSLVNKVFVWFIVNSVLGFLR